MSAATSLDPAQQGFPADAPGHGSTRRRWWLVGGLVVLVGLIAAGAAALAYQQLGGGGAQPESVMPRATVAFVKIDLDPSVGQKVDALRFALKFPATKGKVDESSDLTDVVTKGLEKSGPLKGIDFAKDVKPWLGKRIGLGVMPGATSSDQPTLIVALAVTDQDAARTSLAKIAGSLGGARCGIVHDFALCTQSAQLDRVLKAVGAGTLADSPTFRADMDRLGETGIASAWLDASGQSALRGLQPGTQTPLGQTPLAQTPFGSLASVNGVSSGRVAVALRFDGSNLELAGHATGSAIPWATGQSGHAGLGTLPQGTLAAVGTANPGAQLRAAWPRLDRQWSQTHGGEHLEQSLAPLERTLGVKLPDDLYAALGDQLTLAFGGPADQGQVKLGLLTTGDATLWRRLTAGDGPLAAAQGLVVTQAGGRTVVSSSQGYADELSNGSGLGGIEPFHSALPDAASARFAAYVNVGAVVAAFKDQIPAATAKQLAPLSAVGLTISGQGGDSDFALRLITK